MKHPRIVSLLAAGAAASLVACSGGEAPGERAQAAVSPGQALAGERLFDTAFPGTNGRSCGDCHVKGDARALRPAHVQALFDADPNDPLFADIDVDDPNSGERTFNNLKHGLARVILPLPDNMDVIDLAGNVITNAERTIEVWRAVPSVDNTAYTPGFLHDGRASNLEDQALGAIEGHSLNAHSIGKGNLKLIAQFQRTQFSSDRARLVAEQVELGIPLDEIPNPEDDPAWLATLSDAQRRGKEVYDRACTQCHGGATDNQITSPAVPASLCFMPDENGNLVLDFTDRNGNGVFDILVEGDTVTVEAPPEGCDPFMNIGTGFISSLGQLGLFPPGFNSTATLPQYRFRFYADGTRTEQVTDLPPLPAVNPDGSPAVDERGLPIFGPAGAPQVFTTDPGRAAITGLPQDFEAFDIPQLRGIANTAPYFHDNLIATIPQMVDLYSQFILPFIPAAGVPPIHPLPPGVVNPFGGESMSVQEKADLVEFLEIF